MTSVTEFMDKPWSFLSFKRKKLCLTLNSIKLVSFMFEIFMNDT